VLLSPAMSLAWASDLAGLAGPSPAQLSPKNICRAGPSQKNKK